MPATLESPGGEPLFTLLYVSELKGDDAGEIDRICRRSRANNERDDITGLLVFDGHAFCQFVEGPPHAIAALRERLELDPRHVRMRVLQHGPASPARRFATWRLGYAYSADPAAIARLDDKRGSDALLAFDRIHPSLTAST
jgi:hypothetical protein